MRSAKYDIRYQTGPDGPENMGDWLNEMAIRTASVRALVTAMLEGAERSNPDAEGYVAAIGTALIDQLDILDQQLEGAHNYATTR